MEMLEADELLQPALPCGLNAVCVGKVGLAHAGTPDNYHILVSLPPVPAWASFSMPDVATLCWKDQ